MADSFGLRINQSFKVLGSEMKVVSSQLDKNDNSVQFQRFKKLHCEAYQSAFRIRAIRNDDSR